MNLTERKWWAPPTQPMEWNETHPLSDFLRCLVILVKGEFYECGPHGGCAPFSKSGTTGATYLAAPAGSVGKSSRNALQYATQTSTAGDGYLYNYGRNVYTTSASVMSVFALGYSDTLSTTVKTIAAFGNASSYSARISCGDGAANARYLSISQNTGTSYRGGGANTAGVADFISGSKVILSATAPRLWVNGVESSGTSANFATSLNIQVNSVGVGRQTHATTSSNPGGCVIAGLFEKELTPEEHIAIYENPYQLVRARSARIFSFPSPVTIPTISSVDNSNKFIDDTTLVITGTGFTGATNVYITQAATDSELTIASITGDTTITITTPSVQDTQATYGAATIKVVGPGGTSSNHNITIEKNAAHQAVTLAGHTTGTGWATDLASADGDTLVAPLTQSGSTIVLGADGAISFTPELTNGTLVYRAWYDVGTKTWAEDQVTITDGVEAGTGLTLTLDLRI